MNGFWGVYVSVEDGPYWFVRARLWRTCRTLNDALAKADDYLRDNGGGWLYAGADDEAPPRTWVHGQLNRAPTRGSGVPRRLLSELAPKIRSARLARGWRQRDLADALRCTQGVISQIERGNFGTYAKVNAALTALGLACDCLPEPGPAVVIR